MTDLRKQLTAALELQYPEYNVVRFDILSDERYPKTFVAQNIHLIGKPQPSADGKVDGQPVPMIITAELINIP